jgi:hypothetical protein
MRLLFEFEVALSLWNLCKEINILQQINKLDLSVVASLEVPRHAEVCPTLIYGVIVFNFILGTQQAQLNLMMAVYSTSTLQQFCSSEKRCSWSRLTDLKFRYALSRAYYCNLTQWLRMLIHTTGMLRRARSVWK